MATGNPLERFLAETEPSRYRPGDFVPGDSSRMSVEALVGRTLGSARELTSEGSLRLHGNGVVGTSAALADVGLIVGTWQKLVAAIGGALEDVRSLRGQLPADIVARTTLVLSAAPSPGSVILHIRPKADPFLEVAPGGGMPLMDEPRPLADRASEALIALLVLAVNAGPASVEDLTSSMRQMGPRVGSSLMAFADSLAKSNITVEASWREPTQPTRRAEVTPSAATWIRDFVAGQDFDAEVIEMVGVLRTVSDADRWLVDVEELPLRMDATELDPSLIAQFHVGQRVELSVRTAIREQPDGRTTASHKILRAVSIED